jgi:hypothetical protein
LVDTVRLSAASLKKASQNLVRTGVIVALGDLKPGIAIKGGLFSQSQLSAFGILFFISTTRYVFAS